MHRNILHLPVAFAALALWTATSWAQTSNNMDLLGSLDQYTEYNDIWGYADGLGNEYALLGTDTGTSVINVTDPATAYETGFIPGATSIWRDMKTLGQYAYVVSEGGGGLQIIDLSDPENPSLAATYNGFSSAHNIYIEEATARAYPCGTNNAQGFHVLDLSDPTAPVLLGSWTQTYVHDLYVRDDVAYLAEINQATFSIVDVSNPASMVLLGGPITYPTAFTHNTWLSKDGAYLLTTDENVGGRVRIWNIQNLLNIQQVAEYQAPVTNSIVHNVLVREDLAFVSYYSEGVRVFDISDPELPVEVGYYDTWPGPSGSFDGAWGVYPFLPSGRVLAADITTGLYVLGLTAPGARVQGTVYDTEGTPVAGAQVELTEITAVTNADPFGDYALFADAGNYTLRVTAEGYFDQEQSVTLQECCPLTADVFLVLRPTAALSGTITGNAGSKSVVALESATIELLGTSQRTTSNASGGYALPAVPLGSYTMRVMRAGYGFQDMAVTVTAMGEVRDVALDLSPWYDNADADLGWSLASPGDNATTGLWIRAVPVPSGNGLVQPGVDASPPVSSGICFVTGNAPGPNDSIGVADVDGGITTLTSPTLDMSGIADPYVAYSRWYVNAAGANPGTDVFAIEISNDDGASWATLETLDFDATPWTRVALRVSDFLTPSAQMKVRFVAADTGAGSLVECAIDDLEFFGAPAPPTAVGDEPASARGELSLTAYPNPFNPRTVVHFDLPRAQSVELSVHDVRGRRIVTLVRGERPAGSQQEPWDGRDDWGRPVASGTYLALLRTEDGQVSRKLLLAK